MSIVGRTVEIKKLVEIKEHHERKAAQHHNRFLHHTEKVREACERLDRMADAHRRFEERAR
jgi:hypothetical protein